jgi:hypothetical protein
MLDQILHYTKHCNNCRHLIEQGNCALGNDWIFDTDSMYCSDYEVCRWVTGKTLLKYYKFTDYAMRQIKKTNACVIESHNTYLYNIDNQAILSRMIVIPEIPKHLIRYPNDA